MTMWTLIPLVVLASFALGLATIAIVGEEKAKTLPGGAVVFGVVMAGQAGVHWLVGVAAALLGHLLFCVLFWKK